MRIFNVLQIIYIDLGGVFMFVISIKNGKKKMAAILALVVAVVAVAAVSAKVRGTSQQAVDAGKKYSLSASNNTERIAFFKQFGWQAKQEPLSEKDVTIPEKFNDIYINYNNIQEEQGLDLKPYAGKQCKQYIYEITNYPQQKSMRGTILVYNGKVIGGDLSTTELDGFMTGFDGQIDSDDNSLSGPAVAYSSDGTLKDASSSLPGTKTEETSKPVSSQIPANAWPTD